MLASPMDSSSHLIDDFQSVLTRAPPASEDGKRWPGNFRTWIESNDSIEDGDRTAIHGRIANMASPPHISVLMPVHNPPVRYLVAAINSVRRQLYPYWELCVADDCSTAPELISVLQGFSNRDPRIRVMYRTEPGHIAHASNEALAMATGAFVALLDHDDLLAEHALYMVAEEIQADPDAAIIYSDEDKVDADNVRYGPYFKQHFNRDVLMGQNCVNHLGVFRRSMLVAAGGFRPGTEGAQDYDMTLRVLERTENRHVRHIPHILYHWRAVPGSTALDPAAKDYAFEAGKRAIAQHLERNNQPATVQQGLQPGVYRIQRHMPKARVSLILSGFATQAGPGRQDVAWLQSLVKDIRTGLSEVLVAAPTKHVMALSATQLGADGLRVQAVPATSQASWPSMTNLLVAEATGDVLVFLTTGLCPTNPQAIQELVAQAQRPEMGAAGGRLQRPDGTIMHDGYVMGMGGLCGSFHAHWPAHTPGYFGLNQIARSCAAVSGHALAVRREVFNAVGGFDSDFATAWADVDMCLRLRSRGLGIIYTPFAAFVTPAHVQTPTQHNPDTLRLIHRHRAAARLDPYWNPNLIKQPGLFELAHDTGALKPWRCALQSAG